MRAAALHTASLLALSPIFLLCIRTAVTVHASSSSHGRSTAPPRGFGDGRRPHHPVPGGSAGGGNGGVADVLRSRWDGARHLALLEQSVEDHNADVVATASDVVGALSRRRLVVLPLDERFDPAPGMFSHGHVQTGDKMSLPRNFWDAIQKSGAEVPWLFEVSRIDGVTGERAKFPRGVDDPNLDKVVGGAIDFRSPPNYIFLPRWMMLALALKPRDVVDVRMVTDVAPGSMARLRPHTSEFLKIGNHQAVLETELKHYSSLTRGTTIPFDYRGTRYYFDVVDLRSAPRGEKVPMAKVQDCDIATDFLRAKDQMTGKQKKKPPTQ